MGDDVRHVLRRLSKSAGPSLVVMALLALGLGASLTALGVADSVLVDPLPYPESERLVGFYEQNLEAGIPQMLLGLVSFRSWAEETQAFELLAAYYPDNSVTLSGEGPAERLAANFISRDYFSLLGVKPVKGRDFTAEEHAVAMARPVAMLSHGLWQERFGGRDDILGAKIRLNEQPFTVVGVLPRDFDDLGSVGREIRIWLPLAMTPVTGYSWEILERRTTRFLNAAGRLADGVPIPQAQAEMDVVAARLEQEHPEAHAGYSILVEPLARILIGDFRAAALALLGAAAFLLLVGCANAAHLLLVQATGQRRSIVLELALGLPDRRLVGQLVLGGVAVALPAGVVGLVLGRYGTELLLAWSPTSVPAFVDVGDGPGVVLAGLGLTLLTGVVFGLVSVLETRRADLRELLHETDRGNAAGHAAGRLRDSLIVAEIATAVVLTAGALLTLDSLKRLAGTGPGFDAENLLTLRTDLPAERYSEDEAIRVFNRRLLGELETLPGVEATLLWGPDMPGQAGWYSTFVRHGKEVGSLAEAVVSRYHAVSPGALGELGLPLLRGRDLEPSDDAQAPAVAVVSESLAAALFDGEDAVGQRFRPMTLSMAPEVTVVGVVASTPLAGRTQAGYGTHDLYVPNEQFPRRELNLLLRAPDALTFTPAVRQVVAGLDPGLALYDIETMAARLAQEEEQLRFLAFLLSGFAATAAFLAALGLYSVLAYTLAQGRREIGIRLALGGRARDITATVAARMGKSVACGVVLGLGGVALLGRFLTATLYGVEAVDYGILAGVVALIALASTVAVLVPVRRALGIDPAVVLRAE